MRENNDVGTGIQWLMKTYDKSLVNAKVQRIEIMIGIFSEIWRMDSQVLESYVKNRSWKLLGLFYNLLNHYHHKHRDVKFYADKMNIS